MMAPLGAALARDETLKSRRMTDANAMSRRRRQQTSDLFFIPFYRSCVTRDAVEEWKIDWNGRERTGEGRRAASSTRSTSRQPAKELTTESELPRKRET